MQCDRATQPQSALLRLPDDIMGVVVCHLDECESNNLSSTCLELYHTRHRLACFCPCPRRVAVEYAFLVMYAPLLYTPLHVTLLGVCCSIVLSTCCAPSCAGWVILFTCSLPASVAAAYALECTEVNCDALMQYIFSLAACLLASVALMLGLLACDSVVFWWSTRRLRPRLL